MFNTLTPEQQKQLVNAVLACDCMKRERRPQIINALHSDIKNNFDRSQNDSDDVFALLERCGNVSRGLDLLFREIFRKEGNSFTTDQLRNVLAPLLPDVLAYAYAMAPNGGDNGTWREPHTNTPYIETSRCKAVVDRVIDLISKKKFKGVILHGDPGVGKAILAREVYLQRKSRSRFRCGIWIRIESTKLDGEARMTFDDVLQEILASHGADQQGNTTNVKHKLSRTIGLIENRPTLIVMLNIDNIEDQENTDLLLLFLHKLPPQSFLIMTKRDPKIGSGYVRDYALTQVSPLNKIEDLCVYLRGRLDEYEERMQRDCRELRDKVDNRQFLERVSSLSKNPRKLDELVEAGDFDAFFEQQMGSKTEQNALLNSLNNLDSSELTLLTLICLFKEPTERRIREAWNSNFIENESSGETDERG